jgi:hypothetical protein
MRPGQSILPRLILTWLWLVPLLPAQTPGTTPQGLNPILAELFGDNREFFAQAQVRVIGRTKADSLSMPMKFCFLHGNMRAELDMSRVQSERLAPNLVETLQQIGMDQIVTLMRTNHQSTLVLYPVLKAYVEIPEPTSPESTRLHSPEIKRTKIGRETVDGHVCEKVKVVVGSSAGPAGEAYVWEAVDLRSFPVQIQMKQADQTMIVRYHAIQFEKPDVSQFAAPTNFSRFAGVDEVMQSAAQKLLKGTNP